MAPTLPITVSLQTSASDTLFEFPAGSTAPPLRVRLTDAAGAAVDLRDASVVELRLTDGEGVTLERGMRVTEGHEGVAEYDWRAADTATPGTYRGRVVVSLLDGTTLTCPSGRPFTISITG